MWNLWWRKQYWNITSFWIFRFSLVTLLHQCFLLIFFHLPSTLRMFSHFTACYNTFLSPSPYITYLTAELSAISPACQTYNNTIPFESSTGNPFVFSSLVTLFCITFPFILLIHFIGIYSLLLLTCVKTVCLNVAQNVPLQEIGHKIISPAV